MRFVDVQDELSVKVSTIRSWLFVRGLRLTSMKHMSKVSSFATLTMNSGLGLATLAIPRSITMRDHMPEHDVECVSLVGYIFAIGEARQRQRHASSDSLFKCACACQDGCVSFVAVYPRASHSRRPSPRVCVCVCDHWLRTPSTLHEAVGGSVASSSIAAPHLARPCRRPRGSSVIASGRLIRVRGHLACASHARLVVAGMRSCIVHEQAAPGTGSSGPA